MRQLVTNPRKLRKLKAATGLDIEYVKVRGGTDHRFDLFCTDGVMYYFTFGSIPEPSDCRRQEDGSWRYFPGGIGAGKTS